MDDFGQAELHQFHVARGAEEDVLGLQVSVADAFAMDVLQGQDHQGRIELSMDRTAWEWPNWNSYGFSFGDWNQQLL